MTTGGTNTVRANRLRWLAVTFSLLVVGLGACAGPGENRDGGATDAPARPASPITTPAGDGDKESAKTPADAVESFVTRILQERYVEACLSSLPVAEPGENLEAQCKSSEAKQMMTSLRSAWAKPGVKLPPDAEVKVTDVTRKGKTATVLDSAIILDGRTLRELELIGSSGNTDSFSFSFELQRRGGLWYVSTWNIDI